MSKRFYLTLECTSENGQPFAQLLAAVKTIAPYMVDNVELGFGVMDANGKRYANLPTDD